MTEHTDEPIVTSPDLPANDKNVVRNVKDFVGGLTLELTDDEIQRAFRVVIECQRRYAHMIATRENLEALGDEITYRLAEIGVLAKYDPMPIMQGKPPICEFIGKIDGDPLHRYGFDHEKKQWEVQHATEQGEQFYGEEKTLSKL